MEIRNYKPTEIPAELINLLDRKYGQYKNFGFFLSDYCRAYDYCLNSLNIDFHPIAMYSEGGIIAHVAIIIDKRLPEGEAFFGFIECSENPEDFDILWQAVVDEALKHKISRIKGPVNGSIWHQYRCIKETSEDEYFKSEAITEEYYYNYFILKKPSKEIIYYSASRDPFFEVIKFIDEGEYLKIAKNGFEIKRVVDVDDKTMVKIAEISKLVFNQSWGYTELNKDEFLKLYSSDKIAEHVNSLYLLFYGKEVVGFCSTSEEDKRTLICKTICILPKYQGLGLGNAMAYKIHLDAKNNGYEKMIYALIREGNSINKFPRDDTTTIRKYSSFEFDI